jgi:succinate dehydrogenase/fumarate reductase cytochrome b subunit
VNSGTGFGPRTRTEGTAGAEGNARLTATTGLVLLVLFVVEIVTVALQSRSVLALHSVVGLILIPPVVLKLGSTAWRAFNYYRGVPSYRSKGPPPWWLRFLGPVLAVLTMLVLASGVVLIIGPRSAYAVALFIHKKIFYLWLTAVGLHVAAHFANAVRRTYQDFGARLRVLVPGARLRMVVVSACVILGIVLGCVLASQAAAYLRDYPLLR